MMDGIASGFVGILYAEDFDDPQLPPLEELAPAPPSFTLDELATARQTAGADAVRAARAEWEQSALHDRTQSLVAIATALIDARQEARLLADAVADGTAGAILSVLAGVLPDLCARHGGAEVRALLRHLLPTLAQQPRIAVRVSPDIIDGVRKDLALLDEDVAAAVVLTSAALLPGDARVTWTDGSLVRDQAAIRAAISDALTELGLLEPAATRIDKRSMAFAE
jgi:hypothetical protein